MNISEINSKIDETFCVESADALCDTSLMTEYMKSKSVAREIASLNTILDRHVADGNIVNKIIVEYSTNLIPAGTKGVVRGLKFNKIVKEKLKEQNGIYFETKCPQFKTDEIPDWYIANNGKIIIGMNQLNLWGGGHQLNRGFKYLNMDTPDNVKIICVVCNHVKVKTAKSKLYALFDTGFKNNNLCYLKELPKIINNFMNDVIHKPKQLKLTGLNRDSADKFYTNSMVAEMCVNLVAEHIKNIEYVIEPSAGNGSFIEPIKKMFSSYDFYDIFPENEQIIQQDFLELEVSKNAHIIGNPPFGRQSSMAIKFIKKSCEFAQSISFILPRSFKKDSMKNKFDKFFHLIHQIDLPQNSFLVDGVEYDVPCVFQIWLKKSTKREIKKKQIPSGYTFVSREDDPDISFRRVGVNAGIIDDKNFDKKSKQSHYFIKFDDVSSKNKVKNIVFTENNTVGPKSISKQELIELYNAKLAQ